MVPAADTDYSRATRFRVAVADAAADISDLARQLADPRNDAGRERGELVQDAASLVSRAEQLQLLAVAAERRAGATWEEIGESLGIARQGAHAKYAADVEALNLAIARYWLDTVNGGCPARPPIPEGAYDPAGTAQRLDRWVDPELRGPVSRSLQEMTDEERSNMILSVVNLIDARRDAGADQAELEDLERALCQRKVELYQRMLGRHGVAAYAKGTDSSLRDALAGARARLAELNRD